MKGFTKTDLIGLLAYCLLILLFVIGPLYLLVFNNGPQSYSADTRAEKPSSGDLHNATAVKNSGRYRAYSSHLAKPILPKEMRFDPNKMTTDLGKRLGLSVGQIKIIMNYLGKGGRFKTPDDFRKIYSLTDDDLHRLIPHIIIKTDLPNHSEQRAATAVKPWVAKIDSRNLDINEADSAAWCSLNGIGPVLSARIIKYRERLGGFYSPEQLKEVYGLDSGLVNSLMARLKVKPDNVKKINVNTSDFTTFRRLPYLSTHFIKAIINYRMQHGYYDSIADLRKIKIADDKILRKIAPYLKFDD